ncbi:type II secretion system protein, partial [Patescibacteria group bacterium]|nr:type II secretion system protein [Patescibacteria group bacterium]
MNVQSTPYHIQYNAGQSILEVIVAMAVFALIGAALVTMVVGSFEGLKQGGEQTQAEALAQEGMEAVRSIRDRAWNEHIYAQSGVEVNGG